MSHIRVTLPDQKPVSARKASIGKPAIVKARTVGATTVITIPRALRRVFKVKAGSKLRLDVDKDYLVASFA